MDISLAAYASWALMMLVLSFFTAWAFLGEDGKLWSVPILLVETSIFMYLSLKVLTAIHGQHPHLFASAAATHLFLTITRRGATYMALATTVWLMMLIVGGIGLFMGTFITCEEGILRKLVFVGDACSDLEGFLASRVPDAYLAAPLSAASAARPHQQLRPPDRADPLPQQTPRPSTRCPFLRQNQTRTRFSVIPRRVIWAELFTHPGVKALGLELLTPPGVVTFSNSRDPDTRSSTIDLAFASQSLSSQVEHCRVLDVLGFDSGHRIIETALLMSLKREVKAPTPLEQGQPSDLQTNPHVSPAAKGRCPRHPRANKQLHCQGLRGRESGHQTARAIQVPRFHLPKPPTILELKLKQTMTELDELQATYRKTKDPLLLPALVRLKEEIQRLDTQIWRRFTETSTTTTRGAFWLSGSAAKFGKPRGPCQTPTLYHNGKFHSQSEDKVAVFHDAIFKNNALFDPVPERPPPMPRDEKRRGQGATAPNI
ncbi:hypothetical protein EDB81DRAFT_857612 [Dactylonectria macrodidyma]|uniref:Uncharacterized protein n=1 Tax=Dactylonectria macrodidyma TaxID=307937 RepID=A0A9P9J3J2_9HYPO|nr:hypothetical protein EDB81DRAFT_857612 [Dactylonectria macrodidyma]